jgi:FtsH-binding integral membrane protein
MPHTLHAEQGGQYQSTNGRSNEKRPAQVAYLIRVYKYMATGTLISGLVSWLTFNAAVTESAGRLALTPFGQMIFSGLAILGLLAVTACLIFLVKSRISFFPEPTAVTLFVVYAILLGLMLSSLFLVYTGTSVTRALLISAASFGALTLYSHTTIRDLSPKSSFVFMGLVGLIIAVVVNMFLMSTGLDFVISVAGVSIFALIAALGTRRIKDMYATNEHEALIAEKAALLLYCLVLLVRTDGSQIEHSESQPSNIRFDVKADAIRNAAETSGETAGKWYYSEAGKRVGPVSQEKLLVLVKRGRLSPNTMVWRTGMHDWSRLLDSELAKQIATDSPPPLSAKDTANGYAWALALAPLWGTVLHYALVYMYVNAKYGGVSPFTPLLAQEVIQKTWFFGWIVNIVVAFLDNYALKAAGWRSQKLESWLIFLVPIYLYKRDQMLGAGITRLLVWVVAFMVSLLPIW